MKLDFLAVGPQRTGTTWLFEMLAAHEGVCLPHQVKETFFFDRHFDKGMDWYAWHFRHAQTGQVLGEFAPTYFAFEDAAARIRASSPDCRIVVTLREPVERARSLYRHHMQKGRVRGSFTAASHSIPTIVDAGRYATHVPRWIEAFGRDNVLIVLLDDVRRDPDECIRRVCEHVGIPMPTSRSSRTDEKVNSSGTPRFPIVAKVASRAVTALRARRLHGLVEVGKRLGLNRVYHNGTESLPGLSGFEIDELSALYADDVAWVEQMLGRPLRAWHDLEALRE